MAYLFLFKVYLAIFSRMIFGSFLPCGVNRGSIIPYVQRLGHIRGRSDVSYLFLCIPSCLLLHHGLGLGILGADSTHGQRMEVGIGEDSLGMKCALGD